MSAGWDWDSRDDGRRYTAKPYPKDAQLGAGRPKTRGRKRASGSEWRELHARKNGPCVLCSKPGPNHLHHLLSRARGGPDEAWNLCALCPECHIAVTREDPAALLNLAVRLTDEEYAGLVEAGGEGIMERLFGVGVMETAGTPPSSARLPNPAGGVSGGY